MARYKTVLPNRHNYILSPLGAGGGVKSTIGLIFKMVNFEARVIKLSTNILGLIIIFFGQIGKIECPPPLVLGGSKVQ